MLIRRNTASRRNAPYASLGDVDRATEPADLCLAIGRERAGHRATRGVPARGCDLAYDEWVVAHARISKKPHRAAKLEDTLTFFHQLATLVTSGTPLLQALKIATSQCESSKLQTALSQITAKVA